MLEKFISSPLDKRAQELVGKYVGRTCILLAGGRSVWEDYRNFTGGNRHSDWDVMCVNDVGMFCPGTLEHWFSCHGEQLPSWQTVRRFHHDGAKHLHSMPDRHPGVIPWAVPSMGTSSLAAVHVALCLGYDLTVLCGAPLNDEGHFFDPSWVKTNFANEARHDVWAREAAHLFEGKVKSMSGHSREILGSP